MLATEILFSLGGRLVNVMCLYCYIDLYMYVCRKKYLLLFIIKKITEK